MKVYGYVGDKANSGAVEQIVRLLNGRLTQPDMNVLLYGTADGIDNIRAQLDGLVLREIMRSFVNTWIETRQAGVDENDPDRESLRGLLQDYMVRNPPYVDLNRQGAYLLVLPREFDGKKRLPANIEEIAMQVLAWIPVRNLKSLRRNLLNSWDHSCALLLLLLSSPARMQVFRCDGCGTYFMRTRAPKKDMPLKRGSWCENCKGKGSARRTKDSRDARTKEMIERAADEWPRWKQDRRHGERSKWVAEQVNKKLPANANHIAKNWVTRHQNEIEAEVERRKHAKG